MKEIVKIFQKNPKIFIKIFLILVLLGFTQIGLGYFLIRESFISELNKTLTDTSDRISSDLIIQKGSWNTEKYLSDPLTPHPNGSSGFLNPLYIITTEGFMIERNFPIKGYMDSSDFKHLKAFNTPQFVNGATNERWRVLSKELIYKNEILGIIVVSLYNPDNSNLEEIDKTLTDNMNEIIKKIHYKNNSVDVSNIDIRNVHYEVAFEIVDRFNKVLLNNGRTPSFIDPSYVYTALSEKGKFIIDKSTGELFLVHKKPIQDGENKSRGLIIVAKSLSEMQSVLKSFLILMTVFNAFLIIPLSIIAIFIIRPLRITFLKHLISDNPKELPKRIAFNKKESYILIDSKKINIPYASNQYYLCEAIFSAPNRRWEKDELLKRLGEETNYRNSRKVYDAALAINKKLLLKLVDYKDKTYRLNPRFLQSIS